MFELNQLVEITDVAHGWVGEVGHVVHFDDDGTIEINLIDSGVYITVERHQIEEVK